MKIASLALLGAVLVFGLLVSCKQKPDEAAVAEKENTEDSLGEVVICSFDSDSNVYVNQAPPAYEYKGKVYYFSSEECKRVVSQDPEKYLGE